MDRQLRDAKQAIRTFMQRHWSDEKLTSVYAFNRDGKMSVTNVCSCICAVTLSDTLHQFIEQCPKDLHYIRSQSLAGAREAERGYAELSRGDMSRGQRRLSAIIRAELRRRDRLRRAEREAALLSLAHPNRMRRVEVSDIELASEHCEDATADIAAAILHGATVEGL